jgi:hypothetical protein
VSIAKYLSLVDIQKPFTIVIKAHFTQGVNKAKLQLKSSIPIAGDAKVEIGTSKGLTLT